jgi:hypothetical protein
MTQGKTVLAIFIAIEIVLFIINPIIALIPIGCIFMWALIKAINEGAPNQKN